MNLVDLSTVLWRQRHLLELLLFKLDVEEMILAGGRTRWLAHAGHDIELVLGEIKGVELERGFVLEAVATDLGLPPAASLDVLVSSTPAPWSGIFDDHRRALVTLAQEIRATAAASRDVLARGHDDTRVALKALAVMAEEVDLVNGMM